jgi:Cu+-exporting ATPase
LLLADGCVSAAQLDAALTEQRATRERLGEILARGGTDPERIARALAQQLKLPFVPAPLSPQREALQRTRDLDTVVLDKTGTVTEGKPRVTNVVTMDGISKDEVVALAASLERMSEHPLAGAVVEAAAERGIALVAPEEFTSVTGHGISGRVNGRRVSVGSGGFMLDLAVDVAGANGHAGIFVSVDERLAGLLTVADPLRTTSRDAIARLRGMGLDVIMLTGDNRVTADAIAREAGIEHVVADVLPDQKQAVVERLRRDGRASAVRPRGRRRALRASASAVRTACIRGCRDGGRRTRLWCRGGRLALVARPS